MQLQIETSDPELLQRAIETAYQIAERYRAFDSAGIAFLGALVRGYFDPDADIDIALFTHGKLESQSPPMFQTVDGFQIHNWVATYSEEASQSWPMHKRWAYSECQICHDPEGRLTELIRQKVPMTPKEREGLMISGAALSEWCINRLTVTWVKRGSLLSAHSMFGQGLSHFFDMMFALNERLVPADKWKVYYAARLPLVPQRFESRMGQILMMQELTDHELQRRIAAFMALWEEVLPHVEKAVGKSYQEFKDTV